MASFVSGPGGFQSFSAISRRLVPLPCSEFWTRVVRLDQRHMSASLAILPGLKWFWSFFATQKSAVSIQVRSTYRRIVASAKASVFVSPKTV